MSFNTVELLEQTLQRIERETGKYYTISLKEIGNHEDKILVLGEEHRDSQWKVMMYNHAYEKYWDVIENEDGQVIETRKVSVHSDLEPIFASLSGVYNSYADVQRSLKSLIDSIIVVKIEEDPKTIQFRKELVEKYPEDHWEDLQTTKDVKYLRYVCESCGHEHLDSYEKACKVLYQQPQCPNCHGSLPNLRGFQKLYHIYLEDGYVVWADEYFKRYIGIVRPLKKVQL